MHPSGLFHARQAAGISQDQLSELSGVPKGTISKLERTPAGGGIKLTREWAEKLAPALGFTAQQILFWEDAKLPEPTAPTASVPTAQEALPGPDFDRSDLGPRDVPVLGTAMGGTSDDERGVDFWLSGEVENHVARPKGLARASNVFCLYVGGTSMEPRFEERDMVFVQKTMPGIGDDVVIELHPRVEGGDHPTFIKRLVRRSSTFIVVKQYNPPKELEFSFKEIKNLFRVIPIKELMG